MSATTSRPERKALLSASLAALRVMTTRSTWGAGSVPTWQVHTQTCSVALPSSQCDASSWQANTDTAKAVNQTARTSARFKQEIIDGNTTVSLGVASSTVRQLWVWSQRQSSCIPEPGPDMLPGPMLSFIWVRMRP